LAFGDYGGIRIGRDEDNEVKLWLWIIDDDTGRYVPATRADINALSVSVGVRAAQGLNAIKDQVTIRYKNTPYADNHAYVYIAFIDRLDSVNAIDFDFVVYLTESGTRVVENGYPDGIRFIGSIANRGMDVNSNIDFIHSYDYPVFYVIGNTGLVEIESGVGLSIWSSLDRGNKYYLYADDESTAGDNAVIARYPTISKVYHLVTDGSWDLANSYVTLHDSNMYVYDSNLNYLGTTADKLRYSAVYYLSSSRLNMGSQNNNDQGEDNSNQSSSSGESASNQQQNNASNPSDVNRAAAVEEVVDTILDAKRAGEAPVVKYKNISRISRNTMRSMAEAAGNTPVRVHADTTFPDNPRFVDVRVTFDPAKAQKAIDVSASTTSPQANSVRRLLDNYYDNMLKVIEFKQQSDFGMPMEIAVYVGEVENPEDLELYHYDRGANVKTRLTDVDYWIDSRGYIHFITSRAGYIVISDGTL
jgi:hypothetical protein